ncbi:TPA: hypothetical protein ACGY8I_000221 [Aeromonas hydrophila]|nr:hypothetical protein [Aeromonas hydrophila]
MVENTSGLSLSHKEFLWKSLISALREPCFDFCKPFDADDENGDALTLLFSWGIERKDCFLKRHIVLP